ncbi:MAG: diguanylate cyclase domain-containing protein, partial [Solirubrobacteraceae bacterium]
VGASLDRRAYAASVVVLAGTAALPRVLRRSRLSPALTRACASLMFLAAVALLRQSAGGIRSGVSILSLIPIFYTALASSDRRQLYAVLAGLGGFYALPIVLVGAPPYPSSEWRTVLVSLTVAAIVGICTQRLVASVTFQATEAGRRERMLDQVGRLLRRLFESADPRSDLCAGPLTIGEAASVMLLEPSDHGALISTATAGFDAGPISLPAVWRHPAHEAFRAGRPRLITSRLAELPGPSLWASGEPPGTVLFQPLLKGGDPWGVLVVAWAPGVQATGARATVVALLAHEAAAAIARADEISMLAGMAQTDALTGLPNRRAWDARLVQAAADGQELTIAMLDLDHFKRFNDTHGHPAGDRLLKDTAAAWRDQLRCGDLLVRLGGEEFGLLLFDCDLDAANEVVERLRRFVSDDQSCSAGLALRRGDESVEAAVARADRALYDAKAAGRDCACVGVSA